MKLNPEQFSMFTPVDKDGNEHRELPANEAVDYAYWMNAANPGTKYTVRH